MKRQILILLVLTIIGCKQKSKENLTKLYTYKIYIDNQLIKHQYYFNGSYVSTDTFRLKSDSDAYEKGAEQLMFNRLMYDVFKATKEKFPETKSDLPDSGKLFTVVDYKGNDLKTILPQVLTNKIKKKMISDLAYSRYQAYIETEYKKLHPD